MVKFKIIFFSLLFFSGAVVQAQDYGRINIVNASNTYPPFIVSLNGIRLHNTYAQSVSFKYADETIYRIKILQAGYTGILRFNVGSEPKYTSTYLLTKDNAGNFTMILQNKTLMMGDDEPIPAVNPSITIAAEPMSQPTVYHGPVAMTEEVFKTKLDEVKAKSFDDEKLERIKEAFEYENFTCDQVITLMKLFSFDDKKVDTAIFAYPKTIDQDNFYKTYDLLSFTSSKTKLKDWVKVNKSK